jgi:hypothetical protein
MNSLVIIGATDADIILRSKRPSPVVLGTSFEVHKTTLVAASPIFADMLCLPQPPQDDLPIVDLDETAKILKLFLQFIYPETDPDVDDLTDLVGVISSAIKYEAKKVVKRLRKLLTSPLFLEDEPFRVYAIAVRFGFTEEAKLASTACLAVKLNHIVLDDDFKFITAYDYQRLVNFHTDRSEKCLSILNTDPFRKPTSGCSPKCRTWYDAFRKEVMKGFASVPTSESICSLSFIAGVMTEIGGICENDYKYCGRNVESFLAYVVWVKQRIDDLPDTISFTN